MAAITLATSTKAISAGVGGEAAMADPTADADDGRTPDTTTSTSRRPGRDDEEASGCWSGRVIAIEVPTQSWKRTSSGTPSARRPQ